MIGEWNGIYVGIDYYGQAVVNIGWKQDDDTGESIPLERVLDVRYVGTLGRKQPYTMNVNIADFRYNGLAQAFDAVRNGGESDLLNSIFKGVTIVSGMGAVNGNAGAQLRASTVFNSNLANGNYVALASSLNTYNGNLTVAPHPVARQIRADIEVGGEHR